MGPDIQVCQKPTRNFFQKKDNDSIYYLPILLRWVDLRGFQETRNPIDFYILHTFKGK